MKIGGVDPNTLSIEVFLVLPRGDDKEIVFRAAGEGHGRLRAVVSAAESAGQADPRRLGADGERSHLQASLEAWADSGLATW